MWQWDSFEVQWGHCRYSGRIHQNEERIAEIYEALKQNGIEGTDIHSGRVGRSGGGGDKVV